MLLYVSELVSTLGASWITRVLGYDSASRLLMNQLTSRFGEKNGCVQLRPKTMTTLRRSSVILVLVPNLSSLKFLEFGLIEAYFPSGSGAGALGNFMSNLEFERSIALFCGLSTSLKEF